MVKYWNANQSTVREVEAKQMAYMGNKLVKFGFSQQGFQVEEKVKAFLVRNTRKCIIRVLSLQIGDQLGEFMVTPKMFNGI